MPNDYHMIAYIRESPAALQRTLEANRDSIQSIVSRVRAGGIRQVVITGLGSSYTAAMMAAPLFQAHCPIPVSVVTTGDFGYVSERKLDEQLLVVAVSRSGERGLVVNALREAVRRGSLGVAVTGVADSLLAQGAHLTLVTAEGAEITFPKTKSVTACTGLLMQLALSLAAPGDGEAVRRLRALDEIPGLLEKVIRTCEPELLRLLPGIVEHDLVAFTGSGGNYGAAIEGAMKLMEAANLPTRHDPTDGLLNGPVGALNPRSLVVHLGTTHDQGLSEDLLKTVRRLGAHTLGILEPGLAVRELCDYVLELPEPLDPLLAALAYLPPLQLLAYYWTVRRNLDPDAPASMRAILDAVLPPGREEPELRQ